MKIVQKVLPHDCNLFLMGDEHLGSALHHENGYKKFIEMVNSPFDGLKANRNFIIKHGDEIEAILIDDPRYEAESQKTAVLEQIQDTIHRDRAIAKKILLWLDGNHPLKLWKFGYITRDAICKHLEVEHGTWQAIIEYVDKKGDLMFRHFAAHGYKAVNSSLDDPRDQRNTMLRSLRRQLQRKAGNCVLMSMGHCHRLLTYSPIRDLYLFSDQGDVAAGYTTDLDYSKDQFIHPSMRFYVATGSFFRTLSLGINSYAEMKGYDPIVCGFAVAKVRDKKLVDVVEVQL